MRARTGLGTFYFVWLPKADAVTFNVFNCYHRLGHCRLLVIRDVMLGEKDIEILGFHCS